jgi:cation/acetate symporter
VAEKRDFTERLGQVYGVYVGGFAVFVAIMAGLEYLDVPSKYILWAYIGLTIAVYAFIGIMSRTKHLDQYYVAGRGVPPVYNGMATAADWMSGASFVGMAGALYVLGYDGLAFILGWTGGYVLVAVLIAPYMRKFGAYTAPDFLAARYGGDWPRIIGIIVLICCSFTYVTAQIYASGIIASRFLEIPFDYAVWAGLAGILVCSMLGGMRAVTWTQVAQYIILIVAYLVPAIWMSRVATGDFIPQIAYGDILQQVAALEAQLLEVAGGAAAPFGMDQTGAAVGPHLEPYGGEGFWSRESRDFYMLVFCLMIGTASLPHILMRFFTTRTVREARKSVGWSLLFIFLLYVTAPAYAAFAKFNVFSLFTEGGGLLAFEQIPAWMQRWGSIGGNSLLTICGASVEAMEAVREACVAKGHETAFPISELMLHRDMIVLSTPEIAGMPWYIVGLVGAGGFAAALSTADGLLLAIANGLSHDIYFRMVDPEADTRKRLTVAKVILVLVAIAAALTASTKPSDILSMVAWAFSIAGAGLFAALVLGVWWSRTTRQGAVAGMIAGFGVTMFYLLMSRYGLWITEPWGEGAWWGVKTISSGVFGIPVAFVVTIVVSLLTPKPDDQMRRFVAELRLPRGGVLNPGG